MRGRSSRDESTFRAIELIKRAIAIHRVFALLKEFAASAEGIVAFAHFFAVFFKRRSMAFVIAALGRDPRCPLRR